jgi:chemotaxis signal transduction protein
MIEEDAAIDAQLPVARAPVENCWNEIGIYGNRSCAHLAQCTHCRNCDTYSAAAGKLLDRPAVQGDEWKAPLTKQESSASGEIRSFTVFRVCDEHLALPTLRCTRAANLRAVHRLPHRRSDVILGIANIHGELIVCLSFAALLKLNRADRPTPAQKGKLLVTQWDGGPIAFKVDELEGVEKVPLAQLQRLPATVAQTRTRCTRALLSRQPHPIAILDENALDDAIRQHLA